MFKALAIITVFAVSVSSRASDWYKVEEIDLGLPIGEYRFSFGKRIKFFGKNIQPRQILFLGRNQLELYHLNKNEMG